MKEKANVTNLSFVSGKPFYELTKREEWGLEGPRAEEPLVVRLVGTSGKKKKAVVAVESFSGKAATRSVEEFCQDSGLNMSSHFALSVFFEADANTLAREWCRKMTYFHEIWVMPDDPQYCFSEADAQKHPRCNVQTKCARHTNTHFPPPPHRPPC